MGAYQVKRMQDIPTFEWEWENYPLEEYNSPRLYFDNVGKVISLAGKDFYHENAVEDHWMMPQMIMMSASETIVG